MAASLQSLSDLKGSSVDQSEAPRHVQKLDKQGRAYATGKRKDAVARVWIKPGKGTITVNGRAAHVGQRIQSGDQIRFDGRPIRYQMDEPTPRVTRRWLVHLVAKIGRAHV